MISAFEDVNLVKNENFHDFNLSKYLLDNYPDLSYNVAPTESASGGIQLNIQLALFNIISMVCWALY